MPSDFIKNILICFPNMNGKVLRVWTEFKFLGEPSFLRNFSHARIAINVE